MCAAVPRLGASTSFIDDLNHVTIPTDRGTMEIGVHMALWKIVDSSLGWSNRV